MHSLDDGVGVACRARGFNLAHTKGFDDHLIKHGSSRPGPWLVCIPVQNGGHAMPLEGEDLDSPVVIWDFFSKLPSR
ncbi:MAG TPA: hypothetical protein VK148_13135 [Xanthobacteraceae bacterium]|nr:hypothetical protein [Xanthobacteraceae bacterium]